ncbi:Trp biosynthesis associated, transmembrane protein, Oprn/Chp [Intrasporangium oryzae NRRL B-24470]|uniref:Trp biosynthesis associated, transmembrane protein, Oprn/Chp n=1 Tax=Intrasporangium oryzae NRRL B-24470 TaxID=1386089 RepID=W9GGA7_9MICO|nr:Trp biosynthesis-associated membrane protein [Intrasporangium oryzae]EWT02904.1 Trp biosynthesis associated, transmembrane protein, Oprn/Chp [Intrasporangium oryzae NRRL B-24470]
MRLDKRRAALAVLVPALLLLGLSTRPWAVGEAKDVLSMGATQVSGGAAAPGVVGLTVVTIVALLGLMTGGRVIRAVSGTVLVIAAFGALVLTLLPALRPVQTVADAVARELARTTAPAATGSTTVWAWLAVVDAVLLCVGAVAAAVSSRSWAGLSGRYERGTRPESGPRGEVRTAWDELSEGSDPTLRDAPDET